MFAILGSGFGLYGYLPTLVEGCGQSLILPERYKISFQNRPELDKFSHAIRWVHDENTALDNSNGAVLAMRPLDQEFWLNCCINKPNLKFLILEKPLARSPQGAQIALDSLLAAKKIFRIGYLFRFTTWGRKLLDILSVKNYSGKLFINWSFCAHHYQHDLSNWKRFVSKGGGAIRFFGIHIIALLAEIGYVHVELSKTFGISPNEVEKWLATFTGPGLPECEIMINSRSERSLFQVICTRGGDDCPDFIETLTSPLEIKMLPEVSLLSGFDSRIFFLRQLLATLKEAEKVDLAWYQGTINLWRDAESKSYFEAVHTNKIKFDF